MAQNDQKILFQKLEIEKSRTYLFKLNRKVRKGERNDKMTRKSKSKAKDFCPSVLIKDYFLQRIFLIIDSGSN